MKKIICILIAALAVGLQADVSPHWDDLLLNRDGKEDVHGFTLREWFAAIGQSGHDSFSYSPSPRKLIMGSDAVYFQEQARELILWETRKAMKKEIFSLGFLGYRSSACSWWHYRDYFACWPAVNDRELYYLMFLYQYTNNGRGVSSRIRLYLYAAGDFGQSLLVAASEREKMMRHGMMGGDSYNPEQLKKELAVFTPMSYAAIRERNYTLGMDSLREYLLWYYPAEKIVNDLIDRKLIAPDRRQTLFKYGAAAAKLDDATATKLMPFLTVASFTGDSNYRERMDDPMFSRCCIQNNAMADLAGKNTLIDQQLKKIFADFAQTAKLRENIPAFQLLKSGSDEDLRLAFVISGHVPENSFSLFQRYASLYGSQEEAAGLWRRTAALIESGSYRYDAELNVARSRLAQMGIYLLERDGDLSMDSASEILKKLFAQPDAVFYSFYGRDIQFSPHPKFAPLLAKRFFTDPATSKTAIRLAAMLPFEKLDADVKRWLIEYYFRNLDGHKNSNLPVDVFAGLLAVREPEYLDEICRRLFYEYITVNNQELYRLLLNGGGSAYVPELLRLAAGAEPDDAIKAVTLIGDLSLYARRFSPDLMRLAADPKTDFSVRIAIFCTLAEINAVDSIPFIEKYTADKNKMVAKAARQALVLLKNIASEKDLPESGMIREEVRKGMGMVKQ